MIRRWILAAPLLQAAALYAVVADAGLAGSAIGALALVAVCLGPRVRMAPAVQWFSGIALTGLVFAIGGALAAPEEAPIGMSAAASATALCALLHAVLRLSFAEPHGGHRVTYAVGLLALIACGKAQAGAPYTIGVWLYLFSALAALRAADAAQPRWAMLGARSRAVTLALPLAAGALGLPASSALVRLDRWVQDRFEQAYLSRRFRVGFSERMHLGAMERMLRSDVLVLRVYGPRTDYLRGAVYDEYSEGRWSRHAPRAAQEVATAVGPPAAGAAAVELRRASGEAARLFLPLQVASLATESGRARLDAMGVAYRSEGDSGSLAWFVPGERPAPVAEPDAGDLQMPAAVRRSLAPLAAAWTAGESDVERQLDGIARHLETEYRYALRVVRDPAVDPVVDFLFEHRQGHCEYFAAALALLARSAGIPARVVGGYRVAERNAIGGYYEVRERNAHAWVEAYVPGRGWISYDATPAAAQPENAERDVPLGLALVDALGEAGTRLRAWLAGLGGRELGAVALLGSALLALLQWRRARRGGGRGRGAAAGSRPLPCLLRLLAVLERRGLCRARSETLERYAARIAAAAGGDREAARLIARYAALRYGGIGDGAALEREMDALGAQLARSAASDPPAASRS